MAGDNAWMLVSSALLSLFVMDKMVGLRINGEEEIQGMELSQHGEEGYNLDEEGYNLDLDSGTGSGLLGANDASATTAAHSANAVAGS